MSITPSLKEFRNPQKPVMCMCASTKQTSAVCVVGLFSMSLMKN